MFVLVVMIGTGLFRSVGLRVLVLVVRFVNGFIWLGRIVSFLLLCVRVEGCRVPMLGRFRSHK